MYKIFNTETLNSQFASLCLVFVHGVTDGGLRYVFLHPQVVFFPVTIFISKFIQNSKFI